MSYWTDSRVTMPALRWWKHVNAARAEAVDEDGTRLAVEFGVCPLCAGRGQYVNPSIDSEGLTAEDFAEAGEEFAESYFAGGYDMRCDLCEGMKVVPVPTDPEERARIQAVAEEQWQYAQEVAAERAVGA